MRAMKESQIVVMGGQEIQSCILMLRGVQVMLDRDLAHLYGVTTSALNQAVKRNRSRFPERFMFQMTAGEFENWKSQNVMSNFNDAALRMGLRRPPFAFTEHGVTMLASALKSETAVRVSLSIIDAFVAMRRFLMANADVFRRIETVERKQIVDQAKNEERFQRVFAALDEKKDVNQWRVLRRTALGRLFARREACRTREEVDCPDRQLDWSRHAQHSGEEAQGRRGAAASNAALAWLGGGTIASGGGGMAAGAAVLTGGAVVIVAGVAVIGYYSYKMYDQHEDTLRVCSELSEYRRDQTLDAVLRNDRRHRGMLCGD